ncbi:hypothetical protein B0H10DRAFT_1955915 [Mycena sp. CBHHK59/15]|nr:hypothetical protein B0H10DRAFT_1955915 [Mycena sp. CBHHK59/15]
MTVAPASEVEEEAFLDLDMYDNCDIPLDALSSLLAPSSSSATLANFSVDEDGPGLACAGDAEKSDAEAEGPVVAVGNLKLHQENHSRDVPMKHMQHGTALA